MAFEQLSTNTGRTSSCSRRHPRELEPRRHARHTRSRTPRRVDIYGHGGEVFPRHRTRLAPRSTGTDRSRVYAGTPGPSSSRRATSTTGTSHADGDEGFELRGAADIRRSGGVSRARAPRRIRRLENSTPDRLSTAVLPRLIFPRTPRTPRPPGIRREIQPTRRARTFVACDTPGAPRGGSGTPTLDFRRGAGCVFGTGVRCDGRGKVDLPRHLRAIKEGRRRRRNVRAVGRPVAALTFEIVASLSQKIRGRRRRQLSSGGLNNGTGPTVRRVEREAAGAAPPAPLARLSRQRARERDGT